MTIEEELIYLREEKKVLGNQLAQRERRFLGTVSVLPVDYLKGNKQLKTILCEIATTIAHTPGTYLHALYQRIARRRGKPRAMMAVAHSLLVSIYSMLRDQVSYIRSWGRTILTSCTHSTWSVTLCDALRHEAFR